MPASVVILVSKLINHHVPSQLAAGVCEFSPASAYTMQKLPLKERLFSRGHIISTYFISCAFMSQLQVYGVSSEIVLYLS